MFDPPAKLFKEVKMRVKKQTISLVIILHRSTSTMNILFKLINKPPFLSILRKDDIKYPLGRWHNSGEYYDEKFLQLKEHLKKKRYIMKKYKIDPYYIYCYK